MGHDPLSASVRPALANTPPPLLIRPVVRVDGGSVMMD